MKVSNNQFVFRGATPERIEAIRGEKQHDCKPNFTGFGADVFGYTEEMTVPVRKNKL